MATNAANIRWGAATVYIDTYVSTGTAVTTPTDIGHHKTPVELNTAIEAIKIEGERSAYPIQMAATKASATVKIAFQEVTQANLITFLQGVASGTTTVVMGDPSLVYKQIKVVHAQSGAATHTYTFWKCLPTAKEPLKIAKGEEQSMSITFEALYDDTVSTNDKVYKLVIG